MTPLYIQGMGCISPQKTFDPTYFFEEIRDFDTNKMYCLDPSYDTLFDPKTIRRMSRILKFGVGAAKLAIESSGLNKFDAISTGTGLGCLQDSELFLTNITKAKEGVVSPTPFIQSTHNTVSAIIALQLNCKAKNNTFSHKGFSFESALLETKLIAADEPISNNFLVGSYDEISDYSYAIMSRMNVFRKEHTPNFISTTGQGTIAGEGAAFFVLTRQKTPQTIAHFLDVAMFSKPPYEEKFTEKIISFLASNNLQLEDVDTVLLGLSGDTKKDELLNAAKQNLFTQQNIVGFKHLSGEYMTASSFGMWLGAMIIKKQTIPAVAILVNRNRPSKKVLVCNAYKNNYTLILLSA